MNNTRYEKLFPNSGDKAGAFDKIAEMFYDKNFSSATKTEIELLMFSIYMDATIESCKKETTQLTIMSVPIMKWEKNWESLKKKCER